MMPKRPTKVAVALKEELSQIILQELKDPRLGFVTITRVELTRDMKNAHVFYSVLGEEKAAEKCKNALDSGKGYIRKLLGGRMELRFVPELHFRKDDSIDQSFHITEILRKLKEDGAERAE